MLSKKKKSHQLGCVVLTASSHCVFLSRLATSSAVSPFWLAEGKKREDQPLGACVRAWGAHQREEVTDWYRWPASPSGATSGTRASRTCCSNEGPCCPTPSAYPGYRWENTHTHTHRVRTHVSSGGGFFLQLQVNVLFPRIWGFSMKGKRICLNTGSCSRLFVKTFSKHFLLFSFSSFLACCVNIDIVC